jgi:hypothetical protein
MHGPYNIKFTNTIYLKLWKEVIVLRRVRKLRKVNIIFVMSLPPSPWKNLAPAGPIFMKFVIWVFFEPLSWKIQVLLKSDKHDG